MVAVIVAVVAVGTRGTNSGAPGDGSPSFGSLAPTFLPLMEIQGLDSNHARQLAISPDGRRVALILDDHLHVWDIGNPAGPQPVRGGEGASLPFFSPDGEWIGFFAARELRRVQPGGALPVAMATGTNANAGGAAWGEDDRQELWTSLLDRLDKACCELRTLHPPGDPGAKWKKVIPEVMEELRDVENIDFEQSIVESLFLGRARVRVFVADSPIPVPDEYAKAYTRVLTIYWRLSDEDINTIVEWVDQGALMGDPADMPPPADLPDTDE